MKKIIALGVLLLLVVVPASSRSLGYGLGMYGQTKVNNEDSSSGGVELSFVYQPWLFPVLNPSLQTKVSFGSTMENRSTLPYVSLELSVDVFRTIHHPFNMYAHNIIAYDPALQVGYHYSLEDNQHLLGVGFSPFKFSQKDFWFEFFAFSAALDIGTKTVDSWTINLIRYTYMFK